MTQAEDQELQRLQVNIRRLAGIVAEQNEKLAQLRMLLQQRDEALLAMQEELKSVRRTKRPWPLPRHLSLLIWEMSAVGMPGSSLMGSSVSSTAASASSPVSPRPPQRLSPRYSQRPNSLGPPRPATDIWIPIPAQRPCSVSPSLSSTPASRSTSLAPRNASTAMQVRRLPLRCVSTDISTPNRSRGPRRGVSGDGCYRYRYALQAGTHCSGSAQADLDSTPRGDQ